jgi:hypothetical protein
VSIADIAPTIYDALGVDYGAMVERFHGNFGKSLLGQLGGMEGRRISGYKVVPVGDESGAAPTAKQPASDGTKEEMLERLQALGYVSE